MKLSSLALLLSLLSVSAASAHHSTSEFDRSVIREIEGEVVAVLWRNPHVRLRVRTQGSNGEEEIWTLEGAPVLQLDNGGVPRDSIAVGDHVQVAGNESTRRDHFLGDPRVLLTSGLEVLIGSTRTPYWSDRYVAGANYEEGFSAERIMASRESASGIFRVWAGPPRDYPHRRRPGRMSQVVWSEELPLRESAEAAQQSWNPDTDPINRCIPPGMPRAMSLNPFPVELIADGENILLRLQEYDALRTIHMNGVPADDRLPRTKLGYSVGRWEDGTLVVETTNIDYPLFNRTGVPQSADVQITERFTLNDDQTELGYEITVNDPATFTAPVVGTKFWIWMPGLEIQDYDCGFLEATE
jgi:hypothetical protein